MTDQEKRSLKSYLTNCLEHPLAYHTSALQSHAAAGVGATSYDVQQSRMMCSYHRGKVETLNYAIADFKELFAGELATVED